MRIGVILVILVVAIFGAFIFYDSLQSELGDQVTSNSIVESLQDDAGGLEEGLHPLSIEALRKGEYPGSDIVIEQTLESGSNYQRYIASYKSEGLKIHALLTVPNGDPPTTGWPGIVFNHGYIAPAQYQTTERYVAYVDGFARGGYIVFKPDLRGHGNSQGQPTGAYGSSAYTIDVLNAVASVKKYPGVDPENIGMWGHSMGGYITLRNMVVSSDIKAGVIWAGVVGSYPDLLANWRRGRPTPSPGPTSGARRWRQELVEKYGEPEKNPQFWNSISANSYLGDLPAHSSPSSSESRTGRQGISGPLQLHHGTADSSVPVAFSEKLHQEMQDAGKESELFTYPGDDHNLSANFSVAMQRSVDFFDKYLKN